MYCVYLLRCSDKTLYCGSTRDITKRIVDHNTSKKGAAYTKSRRPVVLVYKEELPDLSSALKREHAIKKLSKKEKEQLILNSKDLV